MKLEEEDLESKSSWDPLTASLVSCLVTGAFVGYIHASNGNINLDAKLILPAITAGIYVLTFRNEANPSRNNLDSRESGKTRLTFIGAGAGAVTNFFGYGIGYGINYVVPKIDYLINKLSFL